MGQIEEEKKKREELDLIPAEIGFAACQSQEGIVGQRR